MPNRGVQEIVVHISESLVYNFTKRNCERNENSKSKTCFWGGSILLLGCKTKTNTGCTKHSIQRKRTCTTFGGEFLNETKVLYWLFDIHLSQVKNNFSGSACQVKSSRALFIRRPRCRRLPKIQTSTCINSKCTLKFALRGGMLFCRPGLSRINVKTWQFRRRKSKIDV